MHWHTNKDKPLGSSNCLVIYEDEIHLMTYNSEYDWFISSDGLIYSRERADVDGWTSTTLAISDFKSWLKFDEALNKS